MTPFEIREGKELLDLSPQEISTLELSILLQDQTLWMKVAGEEKQTTLYLHHWSLPEPYAETLKGLFFEEPLLALPYRRSEVALDEGGYLLIPEDLHERHTEKAWSLPCFTQEEKDSELLSQKIKEIPATLLYPVESELYHFCQRSFPIPSFTHPTPTIIEHALRKSRSIPTQLLLLKVGERSIDMVLAERGKLLLANRYHIQSTEDLLYYITLTWQRFQLSQEETPLYLYSHLSLTDLESNLAGKIRHLHCNHYPEKSGQNIHTLHTKKGKSSTEQHNEVLTTQMPPEWLLQLLCVS